MSDKQLPGSKPDSWLEQELAGDQVLGAQILDRSRILYLRGLERDAISREFGARVSLLERFVGRLTDEYQVKATYSQVVEVVQAELTWLRDFQQRITSTYDQR